jgi:hypothetical protein
VQKKLKSDVALYLKMMKDQEKEIPICPICENKMIAIQSCHLRCNNCGSELTCSDKGNFW